ncbi:lipopolysaccharide transport periplasmic protein LptA [Derxia lacustris]|uniref:lipopolysaccharide transport periplasmic protein LptA n=1 Tax=Derxia lacustris TaxID=764842 RepID=UPI000A16D917|nr:lipopolysaccharide transport periplasmic protein LptA [Derxia lacustris]
MTRLAYLLLALLLAAAAPAGAEQSDKLQETTITAKRGGLDDLKQVSVFEGDVVVTRGTMVMRGERLEVRQDPDGLQFGTLTAGAGKLATFRQKRDGGPDRWVDGEAERIDYDGRADKVTLTRRAQLRRSENGSKQTDQVTGQVIVYDNRSDQYTVDSAEGAGGRVRAVIAPRAPAADGAPADAPAAGSGPLKLDRKPAGQP